MVCLVQLLSEVNKKRTSVDGFRQEGPVVQATNTVGVVPRQNKVESVASVFTSALCDDGELLVLCTVDCYISRVLVCGVYSVCGVCLYEYLLLMLCFFPSDEFDQLFGDVSEGLDF